MNIKFILIILISVLLTFLLNACISNDIEARYFRAKIYGRVADKNQNFVKNAKVMISKNRVKEYCFLFASHYDSTYTDSLGYFSFDIKGLSQRIDFSRDCQFQNGKALRDTFYFTIKYSTHFEKHFSKVVEYFLDGEYWHEFIKLGTVEVVENDIGIIKLAK